LSLNCEHPAQQEITIRLTALAHQCEEHTIALAYCKAVLIAAIP
jgi:hypothetical protein